MLKKLFSLIIALMCWGTLHATHYLGGEVTYQYLGNNIYHFTARIYRDCHHGDPPAITQDAPLIFRIFVLPGGSSFLIDSMFGGQAISMPSDPVSGCIHDTGDYCNNYVVLEKNILLPPNPGGYIFVNQRCCLTAEMTNVDNPGSQGLTLWTNVPGVGTGDNNSAEFHSLPSVRFCKDVAFALDYGATDADNDSLSYRLIPALRGGAANDAKPIPPSINFQPTAYALPYSGYDPLHGAGSLTLNSHTGMLNGICHKEGSYLISMACDEYRNHALINTVTRNFAITIADCNKEVSAQVARDSIQALLGNDNTLFVQCDGNRTVSFKNASQGALNYHWDFGDPGRTDDTSGAVDPQYTYPGTGRFLVTLIAYGINCNDTLQGYAGISDDQVTADFSVQGGPCMYDTLLLTDQSTNIGSPLDQYGWLAENHFYTGNPVSTWLTKPGKQAIQHYAITKDGCIGSVARDITLQQGDIRIFPEHDTTVVQGTELHLHATGGISYQWIATPSTNPIAGPLTAYPLYQCLNTGNRFIIAVISTDARGCAGTDSIRVTVSQSGYVFVPTAFTPNNDGLNDALRAFLSNYNFVEFDIYNRAGREVFHTSDLSIPWDGSYKGKQAPSAVYFWQLKVMDANNALQVFKGDVTLIR